MISKIQLYLMSFYYNDPKTLPDKIMRKISNFFLFFFSDILKLDSSKTNNQKYWKSDYSINWHNQGYKDSEYIENKRLDFLEMLKNFIKQHKNINIIDVGCSYGNILNKISNSCSNNVIGIDLNKKVISEAKKRFPNINFQQGNLEQHIVLINSLVNNQPVLFIYSKVLELLSFDDVVKELNLMNKIKTRKIFVAINDHITDDYKINKSKKVDAFTNYHNYFHILNLCKYKILYKNILITRLKNHFLSVIAKKL